MSTYIAGRDRRFEHSYDAVKFVENTNCAKGCQVPTVEDIAAYGPGGLCPVLTAVAAGESTPIPELDDHGRYIRCLVRIPLPTKPKERVIEQQTGPDLFDDPHEEIGPPS